MPLDSNLYVLALQPRAGDSNWIDFKVDDGMDQLAYCAHKDSDGLSLHDPFLEGMMFARLTATSAKVRSVALDCPRAEVDLRNVGTMSWVWAFTWEEHEWLWTRSVGLGSERAFTLSASRKPDPSFPVAIYTPPSKRRSATLQLLDYNIARVDPSVQDKKGFEILTCLSLVSFLDHLFDPALAPVVAGGTPRPSPGPAPSPSTLIAPLSDSPIESASASPPQGWLSGPLVGGTIKSKGKQVEVFSPPAPARPTKPKRNDSVPAQLSMNEILVADPKAMDAYSDSCLRLLADKSILYIALIGQGAMVPLVVKLGSDVKWKHYKATGEDLRTFIDDGLSQASPVGGGGGPKTYASPTNVKVYISRLDELASFLPLYQPKAPVPPKPTLRAPINLNAPQPPSRPPAEPRLRKKPSQSADAPAPPGGQEGGGGGFLNGWFGGGRK